MCGIVGVVAHDLRRLRNADGERDTAHDRQVDYVVAQEPGAPAVQLIFENRDLTRLFWREPRDLQFGRERALPENVFSWP